MENLNTRDPLDTDEMWRAIYGGVAKWLLSLSFPNPKKVGAHRLRRLRKQR